jgi:excisionase family DNA binding protein
LATVQPDDLLTTSQAAKEFGVSDETIRRWAEDKKVRHVRLPSGQLRFRRSDIAAHLEPIGDLPGNAA